MIRKYLLLVVAAFAMCGCQGQAKDEGQAVNEARLNQAPDVETVTKRVQEIYQDVFSVYNTEDSLRNLDQLEGNPTWEKRKQFNEDYCSGDLNRLLSQVAEIDSLYHSDELGFFEADYWIMAQDWHELSISDLEVLEMSPDEASVQFQLHNCGGSKPVTLHLVLEDGIWKIDDFLDVNNDLDLKKAMQEYVKEETERNK